MLAILTEKKIKKGMKNKKKKIKKRVVALPKVMSHSPNLYK